MFPLTSARQVTTGSLAPLDQSQRHGCTGKADSNSWNQAVQRMEYILTGLKAVAAVTGCSVGGWPTAAAQGRPRGCAEPASSRSGPASGTRIPASASSAGRGTAPWRATGCSRGGAGSLGAASEARAPGFRAGYRRRLRTGPADGSGAAQSGGRRREATRMPLRHCHLRSRQAALEPRRRLCRLSSRRLDPNDAPYPRHGSSLGLCSPWLGRRRPHAAAAAHPATGSSALRIFGSVAQRDKPRARRRLRGAQHLQSAPQWAPGMCCPAPSPGAPAQRLEQPATAALAG